MYSWDNTAHGTQGSVRGKPKASPGPSTRRHRTPLCRGMLHPNSLGQTRSRESPERNKAVPGQGRGRTGARGAPGRSGRGSGPAGGAGAASVPPGQRERRCRVCHTTTELALARDRGSLVPKSAFQDLNKELKHERGFSSLRSAGGSAAGRSTP